MSLILLSLLAAQSPFQTAADNYLACLTMGVRLGMSVNVTPDTFASAFGKMCLPEEARFRDEAVKAEVASGKSQAEAFAAVEANIASGRRIFIADQAEYKRTGKVPR